MFILQEYLLRPDTSCYGGYGEYYSALSDAQNACSKDKECAMVTGIHNCDGRYKKCKGPITETYSGPGPCTWTKGKL